MISKIVLSKDRKFCWVHFNIGTSMFVDFSLLNLSYLEGIIRIYEVFGESKKENKAA
jgi:hypothetical protein